MIVYVAGPYRGNVDENIQSARRVAIELWEKGLTALCPHLNTAHFEKDCSVEDDTYLSGDLEMLARCDAIVMAPGWDTSAGASVEKAFAEANGIPVYIYPGLPSKHPTEIQRPNQAQHFIATVMKMYRVHLDKNADYSPANIMGAGEIGLMTRVWDKVAHLMNLVGFRVEISSTKFEQPKRPKCEAMEDTVMDLAVYAIIWQLFRNGVWGK